MDEKNTSGFCEILKVIKPEGREEHFRVLRYPEGYQT
jgi:hypothetical protein